MKQVCSISNKKKYLFFFQDKINQWGAGFREGYTRLGLLKPFFAESAPIFCLTATATDEDIMVYGKGVPEKNILKNTMGVTNLSI